MTMTVAMTKPVVTQVICSTVTPSDPVRWGTATLTIDASIAPISVPKVIETVTSHLFTGARCAGIIGAAITPVVTLEPRSRGGQALRLSLPEVGQAKASVLHWRA